MLNVSRGSNADGTVIHLGGDLDENSQLDQLLLIPERKFQINCRGIRRINSMGVRAWVMIFRKFTAQQRDICFIECSPAFVLQFNLFPDFVAGYEVRSICGPYFCDPCQHETLRVFTRKDLGSIPLSVECEKCKGQAAFDDDLDSYFEIWTDP